MEMSSAETTAPLDRRRPMRRAKRRAETVAQIKSLALQQLSKVGGAGLNLRAIARELEMSSAGIYRYYESRDELLIALITDGFDSLGADLRQASGDDSRDPNHLLVDLLVAYRAWALGSPHLFVLLFTDPVPGYVALEDGPTTPAVRRALAPLTSAAARAIDPPWPVHNAAQNEPFPSHVFGGMLRTWSVVHGFVSLELFHHLDWADTDLDAEFDRLLTQLVESFRAV